MSTSSLDQELRIEGQDTISNIEDAFEHADVGFIRPLEKDRSKMIPLMVPLRSLVEWMHGEALQSLLDDFKSEDIDGMLFLRSEALQAEEESIARTYMFMDVAVNPRILGFFTVGTSHLHIPGYGSIPSELSSALNVSANTGCAPTYLISHVCAGTGSPIDLGTILNGAMSMIRYSWRTVGCKLIRLDCTDRMLHFYQSRGFTFIRKNEEKDLNQLLYIT